MHEFSHRILLPFTNTDEQRRASVCSISDFRYQARIEGKQPARQTDSRRDRRRTKRLTCIRAHRSSGPLGPSMENSRHYVECVSLHNHNRHCKLLHIHTLRAPANTLVRIQDRDVLIYTDICIHSHGQTTSKCVYVRCVMIFVFHFAETCIFLILVRIHISNIFMQILQIFFAHLQF